ncbi:MAG: hypothetical protein PW734_07765 [Verrucomicrobium sp.]|nr:hypothetical protein [Verrucomicrobium sp.]
MFPSAALNDTDLRRRPNPYEKLIEKLAALEVFQRQLRECDTQERVIEITADHVRRLVPFYQLGFWMVDPERLEFVPGHCYPAAAARPLQEVVADEIGDGTFAWALQQTRAVLVNHQRTGQTLFLNGLSTRSRTLGMFVGIIHPDEVRQLEHARELLSLIFLGVTYTLENFQLLAELKKQA